MTHKKTHHKKMEELLQESEEKYHSLLEYAYDAILIADLKGNLLEVNKKAGDLLGYRKEELIGKNISQIHPEQEVGRALRAFRKMVEGEAHSLSDTKVLRKDGKTVDVDIRGGIIQYAGKKVAQAIFRDISKYKGVEERFKNYQEHLERLIDEKAKELIESEIKFRNMFDNAIEGIYQTTPEGRFLMVNPTLARMYGYETPEELVRSIKNIGAEIYADPEQRKNFLTCIERDGIVQNFEIRARRKDGLIKYVSLNARAVKDKNGKILYFEGTVQDIDEKNLALEQIKIQRDLAVSLAKTHNIKEGLAMILQTTLISSGMECGGITLKNNQTGDFDLIHFVGLRKVFQKQIEHVREGSYTWSRMMEKKGFHLRPNKNLTPIAFAEGFTFISVMPMLQEDEVIGFLVTASKSHTQIAEQVRIGLEAIVAESGSVIAKMQARQQLEEEIIIRKETEKALEAERQCLQKANTDLMEAIAALKVLLKQREDDKKDLEEKVSANVQQLIMPFVEKLKKRVNLDPLQEVTVNQIELSLRQIISPLLKNIRDFNFTPRQIEVISLIREGRTTKDIAQHLMVSKDAIDLQRYLIRKKLGMSNQKINLRSFLLSLS